MKTSGKATLKLEQRDKQQTQIGYESQCMESNYNNQRPITIRVVNHACSVGKGVERVISSQQHTDALYNVVSCHTRGGTVRILELTPSFLASDAVAEEALASWPRRDRLHRVLVQSTCTCNHHLFLPLPTTDTRTRACGCSIACFFYSIPSCSRLCGPAQPTSCVAACHKPRHKDKPHSCGGTDLQRAWARSGYLSCAVVRRLTTQ